MDGGFINYFFLGATYSVLREMSAPPAKRKRLSSLVNGFVSGVAVGMIITSMGAFQSLKLPFSTDAVIIFTNAVIWSVALFVWNVYKVIAAKD
jgi:hypothetical protein